MIRFKKYFNTSTICIIISLLVGFTIFVWNDIIFKSRKLLFLIALSFTCVVFIVGIIFLLVWIIKNFKYNHTSRSFNFKEKQISLDDFQNFVIPILVTLRDKPYEHLVIELENFPVNNIKFIQTIHYEDYYLLELGTTEKGKSCLYRLKDLNLDKVVFYFHMVCVLFQSPNLIEWEHVSDILENNKNS